MGDDASSKPEIRILLAYENEMIRAAVRDRFKTEQPDLVIVAEAQDGKSAVRLTGELMPDVVLMDVVLPVMNGIEATRQIAEFFADVRVVGFSIHDDPRLREGMQDAGARAYLLLDRDWDELPNKIRNVVAS